MSIADILLDPIGELGDIHVEGHANGDYTYVETLGPFTRRSYRQRQEPQPTRFMNQHGVVYDPEDSETWGGNAK